MRDYGIPSIAELLDRTREFGDHGVKRYDDTILIGDEATLDGIDSPALARRTAPAQPDPRPLRHHQRRVRLRPRHHDRRPGPLDRGLRLAPARPPRAGRHRQGDHPLRRADGHPRPPHDVRRLPRAARRPRAAALRPHAGRHPAGRVVDPDRPGGRPSPAAAAAAPGDDRGDGRAAARGARAAAPARAGSSGRCAAGCGCAAGCCGSRPPRRTAYVHRPTTYPHGYRLEDLGPPSMLDALNAVRVMTRVTTDDRAARPSRAAARRAARRARGSRR